MWLSFADAFPCPEPTDDLCTAYVATTTEGQRQAEQWLSVLVREDTLPEVNIVVRAGLVNAILIGLFVERVPPNDDSVL